MKSNILFEGKKFVISGAGSGIGQATAKYLNELGAEVIMVGRRMEKLQETQALLKGNNNLYSYDLSDIDGIESLIKRIVTENGAIDGFVHCAGISENRPLLQFKYSVLHKIMLTNFYSFFEIVRVLSRKGNYNPNGMSIVAISSVAAIRGAVAQSAYSASKAAINGAMISMAKELAPKKIRINTIMPAAVETDMIRKYYSIKQGLNGNEAKPDSRQYLGMCQPESIASGVAFLLSSEANWITGVMLPIDGGYQSC